MATPSLVITIDVEGDNLWARPERVTTENTRYLPRFHNLCEEFGFKPTYLVTYEMAQCPRFQEFGRRVLRRESGEIGLHIHPWSTPPLHESPDPRWHYVYLYELPDEVMDAKIRYLTRLIADTFEVQPISHRAGRWAVDERVARTLVRAGYTVDCSITPGVSRRRYKGDPRGNGGPCYFGFPVHPYFMDLNDIRRPGTSPLLEVPVTIKPNYPTAVDRLHRHVYDGFSGKVIRFVLGPSCTWLRPNGRNLRGMLKVIDWAVARDLPVLQFVLHSSELMPGGSPTFPTEDDIVVLYQHMTKVFKRLAAVGSRPVTLKEYRVAWSQG